MKGGVFAVWIWNKALERATFPLNFKITNSDINLVSLWPLKHNCFKYNIKSISIEVNLNFLLFLNQIEIHFKKGHFLEEGFGTVWTYISPGLPASKIQYFPVWFQRWALFSLRVTSTLYQRKKDLSHFCSIMLCSSKPGESWLSLSIIFSLEIEKEEQNKKETTIIY